MEVAIVNGDNNGSGGGYLILAIAFGSVAFGIARGAVWGLTVASIACVVLAMVSAGGSK